MSFTFRIDCPRPTVDALQMAMRHLSLRCLEDLPPTGPWPVGHFHFYRDKVSTRTTEVAWDGKTFSVRVFTLACPDDYHIAVELAATSVRVYAICPGFVDTDITRSAAATIAQRGDQTEEQVITNTKKKRMQ